MQLAPSPNVGTPTKDVSHNPVSSGSQASRKNAQANQPIKEVLEELFAKKMHDICTSKLIKSCVPCLEIKDEDQHKTIEHIRRFLYSSGGHKSVIKGILKTFSVQDPLIQETTFTRAQGNFNKFIAGKLECKGLYETRVQLLEQAVKSFEFDTEFLNIYSNQIKHRLDQTKAQLERLSQQCGYKETNVAAPELQVELPQCKSPLLRQHLELMRNFESLKDSVTVHRNLFNSIYAKDLTVGKYLQLVDAKNITQYTAKIYYLMDLDRFETLNAEYERLIRQKDERITELRKIIAAAQEQKSHAGTKAAKDQQDDIILQAEQEIAELETIWNEKWRVPHRRNELGGLSGLLEELRLFVDKNFNKPAVIEIKGLLEGLQPIDEFDTVKRAFIDCLIKTSSLREEVLEKDLSFCNLAIFSLVLTPTTLKAIHVNTQGKLPKAYCDIATKQFKELQKSVDEIEKMKKNHLAYLEERKKRFIDDIKEMKELYDDIQHNHEVTSKRLAECENRLKEAKERKEAKEKAAAEEARSKAGSSTNVAETTK